MRISCAISKAFLVEGGQECVLNGRAGFPDLVEEDDVGVREIAIGDALVTVLLFQSLYGDRAEDLVGCAEATHEVLEGGGIAECEFEPASDEALGDARRAEEEDTFARGRGKKGKARRFLALVNACLHRLEECADAISNHGAILFLHSPGVKRPLFAAPGRRRAGPPGSGVSPRCCRERPYMLEPRV